MRRLLIYGNLPWRWFVVLFALDVILLALLVAVGAGGVVAWRFQHPWAGVALMAGVAGGWWVVRRAR